MASYIGLKETDKLLYKYPMLKALLVSLQIELESVYYEESTRALTEEEVLYALYFARELTDMPRSAPRPGDKIINVIMAKDHIMQEEYPRELVDSIKIIGAVVKKTAWALSGLSQEEGKIIEMRYFEGKSWMEIESIINLAQTRLGEIRKNAVEKMLTVMHITQEQYEFCMARVK